jgi:DNA-3-methyladenine glycosylase II
MQPMRPIRHSSDIDEALAHLRRADRRLDPVVEAVLASAGEVPLRLSDPGFASLASIVVSQQVSKASADAIYGRLSLLVDPLDAPSLLSAGEDTLREAGLSRPKQKTLLAVAGAVCEERIDLHGLCGATPQDAIAAMTAIHGIGPWTAEIYLLFCAGHPDIFPAGDLALQEAARSALSLEERPSDRQLRGIAEAWSPWRGVAARLLWSYYAVLRGRDGTPS